MTRIASKYGLIPPDHRGVYGVGETLTYAAHRLLVGASHAREFDRNQISENPVPNGAPPRNSEFRELADRSFADWKLALDGMVERPQSLSLAELKALPARSQITQLGCEEGWCYIAEWTGTPLSEVLTRAGVPPRARYVVYFSLDENWWDSIDIDEAMHSQTLLTYGMNGKDLPLGHGAPLRLRVPRQLGYKSVKHLARMTVTDDLSSFRTGLGAPDSGYSWYAGI